LVLFNICHPYQSGRKTGTLSGEENAKEAMRRKGMASLLELDTAFFPYVPPPASPMVYLRSRCHPLLALPRLFWVWLTPFHELPWLVLNCLVFEYPLP